MVTGEARATRSRWFPLVWIIPAVLAFALVVVLVAKGFRASDAGASFLRSYPGQSELPASAPVGFPAWLEWQHFLNSFFILFLIRSGWQIRTTTRRTAAWTRDNRRLIHTKNPPVRISLTLWFHLTIDSLWVLNGVVFYVLVFVTGQWLRIVPVHWDVVPNALSAAVQYASLQWPVTNGWANYNALQLLSYFATVFVAAPLAVLTGLRTAPGFAARLRPFDNILPIRAARRIHFAVMVYFVVFIVVHVTLVLATGALRNLNHMYAGSNDVNWIGFGFFAGSLVVMAVGWLAARPSILAMVASLTGSVRG